MAETERAALKRFMGKVGGKGGKGAKKPIKTNALIFWVGAL